jgi:hypothetical protein
MASGTQGHRFLAIFALQLSGARQKTATVGYYSDRMRLTFVQFSSWSRRRTFLSMFRSPFGGRKSFVSVARARMAALSKACDVIMGNFRHPCLGAGRISIWNRWEKP